MPRARDAMVAGDISALERIVTEHPALLCPSEYDLSAGSTLMRTALWQERVRGAAAVQPIMGWLTAHGFDRQGELNASLRGHPSMTPAEVRSLLDQGADPNWVTPGGVPVLEHALLRYWNADAVDVLAARATPRRTLWIAAALGHVDGVRNFLDANGRPTPAARQLRPDFVAAGRPFVPLVDADDEELLAEALLVATLNGRTAMLEHLASRGALVNTLVYGMPLVTLAVGNGLTAAVEGLVRVGADLDLRGGIHARGPSGTARELARELFEQAPEADSRRRIVELCGMDPETILAARDARPVPPPPLDPTLERALSLARHDAAGLGLAEVRPENLLVGLRRGGGPPLYFLKNKGPLDVEQFRADLAERLGPAGDNTSRLDLPMHADAQAALESAAVFAAQRRAGSVEGLHLLYALTAVAGGAITDLLARYGASSADVNAALATGL